MSSIGSEQCCTNIGPEKDCDEKDKNADSCTNTGNSLNSNNRACNASLPMVEDNATDYIPSGTIEKNNKTEYKNVEFSSCLVLCIFEFSLEQDSYFIRETSFHQFSNMASSGLKKMLSQ